MTVRTRTPDTRTSSRPPEKVAAHTRDMLESILRPHSLEELYALVGSFPFKSVKVASLPLRRGEVEYWPVGKVIELVAASTDGDFVHTEPTLDRILNVTPGDLKQWRLAE